MEFWNYYFIVEMESFRSRESVLVINMVYLRQHCKSVIRQPVLLHETPIKAPRRRKHLLVVDIGLVSTDKSSSLLPLA